MPIPSAITDMSPTPASNSPAGSESAGTMDDYLRTLSAFIRQNYDTTTGQGGASLVTMTSSNVTLSATEYARKIIILSGALTTNLDLIFPASAGQWLVVNNCTGAYTVTSKTSAGTGVVITQGQTPEIYGDGTNIYFASVVRNISTATAGGTADAITATFTPPVAALVNGVTVLVRAASANATTTPTFSPNGLTAKTIVKGSNAALVAGDVDGAGHWLTLSFDATLDKWVLQNPAFAVSATEPDAVPAVRQTVLSGPVDTSGLPSFGGSTGSTTVTASGTIVCTSASGTSNRIGTTTNPSWTGLSTDGTMYLYLEIDSAGACTTGSTTLAPTYRWGGADVTTSDQHTYNIQEMQMKVGNGSTASQTWRVFVGEVTVASSVVSAITWYAIMGRYYAQDTSPPSAVRINKAHNIGLIPHKARVTLVCQTADVGYSPGDEVDAFSSYSSSTPPGVSVDTMNVGLIVNSASWNLLNKTTGGSTTATAANWDTAFYVDRGW